MRVEIRRSKKPRTPWVVYVPLKLSGGKEQRRYFKLRTDAADFARDCESKLGGLGAELWQGLTPGEISELADYASRLRERRGIERVTASTAAQRFYDAQHEAGASQKYLQQIRYEGRKFAAKFADRPLGDITRGEVLAWIQSFRKVAHSSRFATFRITNAIFGHSVTMGWTASNPCAGLSRQLPRSQPPKQILRPDQLRGLLSAADERIAKPSLCLGAFAGLRPVEVTRLHWEDIDWANGQVFVRPDVAKQTKQHRTEGRFVTITDALREWLMPGAKKSGPIIPVADAAFKRAKRAMTEKAGVTIPHDALRHSFATYHYALHGDGALTAKELGHTTTTMTFRAYARRDVAKQDAEKWFGTRPPRRARNVIPMRKAG